MPESEKPTVGPMYVGTMGGQFSITMQPWPWWHWRGWRPRVRARRRGERYGDRLKSRGAQPAAAAYFVDPRHMLECCPGCGTVVGAEHMPGCSA